LAHSGEVAVALLDTVDGPPPVPGEIMTKTIRWCIEVCSPRRHEQFPTELETCQHPPRGLPSACARMDFGKLVLRNVRGSLAVNFAEHDGWALVGYVNHTKEAKRDG
jgi:hypothetical protein